PPSLDAPASVDFLHSPAPGIEQITRHAKYFCIPSLRVGSASADGILSPSRHAHDITALPRLADHADKPRFTSSDPIRSTPLKIPTISSPISASGNPVRSTVITINPSSVPSKLPRPPKIDVPPSTTAVIASSSYPVPTSALA